MNKYIFVMVSLLTSCVGMSQSKKIKNLAEQFQQQELITYSILNYYENNDWEEAVNLFEENFGENISNANLNLLIAIADSYKKLTSDLADKSDLIKRSEAIYKQGQLKYGDYLMNNGYKIEIYDVVDQPAEPEVGRSEFSNFLAENYIYPASALASSIEGLVTIQMIVTPTGELHGLKIIKGVNSQCDQELMKLLKESSPWKPAIHRNEPVHVREIVTLNFNIKQYNKRNK